MTMLRQDEPSQHERIRNATRFTYRYGMVDGEKTWHLAAVGNRPVIAQRKQSSDTSNAYQLKDYDLRDQKSKNDQAYRARPRDYQTLKHSDVGATRGTRDNSPGLGPLQHSGNERQNCDRRNQSSLTSDRFTGIAPTRRYRYQQNQNSEGNSDTSESELGLQTHYPLDYKTYDRTGRKCVAPVQSASYRGYSGRRGDSGIGDVFTSNAESDQNQNKVSYKIPASRTSDKRTLFDEIHHRPGRPVGVVKADRSESKQVQTPSVPIASHSTVTEKKPKRLRKIYVNGLWIPVRSKKDIHRLFSTEPVVVLERIPSSVLERVTSRGKRQGASAMSLLDTPETGGEMGEDIDELKQNIAENNLGDCDFPMDLSSYSLGAPDKLFEVDQSISFNISKLRKACEAFRTRQTNTGPDPVLSDYRSDEEERLQTGEPEYVYFDEPTETDEVFHDPYNIGDFSDKNKYLDLPDTRTNVEAVSTENCDNSGTVATLGSTNCEENFSKSSLGAPSEAKDSKRVTASAKGCQESGSRVGEDGDEGLNNVFYRNRDSTDPAEPYSPEYIEPATTPPLLVDCNTAQSSKVDSNQPPPDLDKNDSFPLRPVSPLPEDAKPSAAQKQAGVDRESALKDILQIVRASSPRVVSATPVTAAGETIIIEEMSSPQNAVIVSDNIELSESQTVSNPDHMQATETANLNSALKTEADLEHSEPPILTLAVAPKGESVSAATEITTCAGDKADNLENNVNATPSALVCEDYQMDVERDEPYPLSMVVVQDAQGGEDVTGVGSDPVKQEVSGDLSHPREEGSKPEQFDFEVFDLSTNMTTENEKDRFMGSAHEAASSLNGSSSVVFEESFPYGFQLAPSVANQAEANNIISADELAAMERMANGNMSDDEVFPRLVIAEENSNMSNVGSPANESDLVIGNVISLKNVAQTYLNEEYHFKDFNLSISESNGEGEQGRRTSLSELNDDTNKISQMDEASMDDSEALDMTSVPGRAVDNHPLRDSPESAKSEGSLKCVLSKKSDDGAQVRYVIKSLSSVDSDDSTPFFALSRDERGDPPEPPSPEDGRCSPNIELEHAKKPVNTYVVDAGYVTREQAIRTCDALADVSELQGSPEQGAEGSTEKRLASAQHVPKSHKKAKKKKGRDLKRPPIVVKNRSNFAVGQGTNKFIKRSIIRKNRISSTLKQFNTRSKSLKLGLKVTSTGDQGTGSKKTENGHVKRTLPAPQQEAASDMSSDLSDLGELVEQAIMDGRPIKKRKIRTKKLKHRAKDATKDVKDTKTVEDPKRENSTEGDDLPEILPPKRRRIRNPPCVTTVQIEENEVLSRLSQEFPKHNWLENKIKQIDQNHEESQRVSPQDSTEGATDFSQAKDLLPQASDLSGEKDLSHKETGETGDESRTVERPDLSRPTIEIFRVSQGSASPQITSDSGLPECAQQDGDDAQHPKHRDGVGDDKERHVESAARAEETQHEVQKEGNHAFLLETSRGDVQQVTDKPMDVTHGGDDERKSSCDFEVTARRNMNIKATLDGMIEARLMEDFKVGDVVDLSVSQPTGSASEKEVGMTSPQGMNDVDRTGNYWSVGASNFNIRGPQQRTTKHTTPVLRVQPQIKSTQDQSEVARTQTEAVAAIKRQMSKMEETTPSSGMQRGAPGREVDKATNASHSGPNVPTASAASGGPVSVVPPIQTMPPKSLPPSQPKPPAPSAQTIGVHRSAQLLYQQTQSMMNQSHIAQVSHVSQLNHSQKGCPQLRAIAPKPVMVYQHRPVLPPQTPVPQNKPAVAVSMDARPTQSQLRPELPSPKTPPTPVLVSQPDASFPRPATTITTTTRTATSQGPVIHVMEKQSKGVRPMTPATFAREYQKMKREFQRIEAMLTIKERERKQLLFMKNRMSLLIEKMENKLRSLPVNFSPKLTPYPQKENQSEAAQKVDVAPATSGSSGPPPAHVKEPFSQPITRNPDLKTAHSNKTSTVPRHLIYMDKEPRSKETSDNSQPQHEQPNAATEHSDPKRKEEGPHPSAWKRYANNLSQEGCLLHTSPTKEQEQNKTKKSVEIIDLTTESPSVINGLNLSNRGPNNGNPAKQLQDKDKEQRVQEMLHDVQSRRAPGNPWQAQVEAGRGPAHGPQTLYSPNSTGPPALVTAGAPHSTTCTASHAQQLADARTAPGQRPMETSGGTAKGRDSGRQSYTTGSTQLASLRPQNQYTPGVDLGSGVPRLSGYNPPYANHSVGETIKARTPEHGSAAVSNWASTATSRHPSGHTSQGPSTVSTYGPATVGGPHSAFGVPSSSNLPSDRPGSVPRNVPSASTLDRRSFLSTAPVPSTPPAPVPVPAASPSRQSILSASPARDPTRRPSFPGTPVQTIDMAATNTNLANAQDLNDKMKLKKKAPKRATPVHPNTMPPHPMSLQPGQFYRGQTPMMTMDPRSQHSMQAPRLLRPDQRSPQDMYLGHQADIMPGMIQMSPRAQMMHQVRPAGPPKQQVMGYGEQHPGLPVQDPNTAYGQREYAQHQRMMQPTMGMMQPQQQASRMPMVRSPGQAMIMQHPSHQVPQYPMPMPSMMTMEAQRSGRDMPPHTMGAREGPHTMGAAVRELPPSMYPSDSLCVVCNQRAAFLCSGCKRMWYCSKTCQAKSWQQNHKMECPAAMV